MIVKNEEKNIKRALTWGKDMVCEQIVVDTGSTDRTVEIAESMGASVYHFKWIDDFSAAKNFAIEKASGDWIAFLDADEYYLPEDVLKLERIIKGLDKKKGREQPDMIRSAYIVVDDNGTPFARSVQDRVFKNTMRYKGRIHEELTHVSRNDSGLTYYDGKEELSIFHTGYSASAYDETKKAERNIRLLEKELEDNNENPQAMIYLADALRASGRNEDSEKLLWHMVEEDMITGLEEPFGVLGYYTLMTFTLRHDDPGDEVKLEELYKRAVSSGYSNPDFDYLMGIWYVRRNDWGKGIYYLEKALKDLEGCEAIGLLNISGDLKTVYRGLAISYNNIGDKESMMKYLVLTLRADKHMTDILMHLISRLMSEPGESDTASGTVSILEKLYDFTQFKDKLLIYKVAENVGFTKLKEEMYNRFNTSEKEVIDKNQVGC